MLLYAGMKVETPPASLTKHLAEIVKQRKNDNKHHTDSETITGPETVQIFSYLQLCSQYDMWQAWPFIFPSYPLQGNNSGLKQQK